MPQYRPPIPHPTPQCPARLAMWGAVLVESGKMTFLDVVDMYFITIVICSNYCVIFS